MDNRTYQEIKQQCAASHPCNNGDSDPAPSSPAVQQCTTIDAQARDRPSSNRRDGVPRLSSQRKAGTPVARRKQQCCS